ncbi:hypothetical protein F7725_024891 [Dissostichus mawsoni]|uniref:Uncharacterized protein n=1 Tax=Dissostichus mawsoni TaxID=36200 RepID=A0A7J5XAN9_DISMA|nr:hypothetical protein F7725_024891 [Dissostichus mawsoni]
MSLIVHQEEQLLSKYYSDYPSPSSAYQRRNFSSVLRRFLRSFPGAHGCHNPDLELRVSQVLEVSMYDQVFNQTGSYDMRLHRDDRKHHKGTGLDINEEEKLRIVPVRSSAEYGRRPVPALFQRAGSTLVSLAQKPNFS